MHSFNRPPNPTDFSFPSSITSSGAIARDAAQLAPTKALKTGARATPHTAPQPPIGVDPVLEAEAVKLREAVARGAQEAQLARALESGGNAGESGVVTAARADAEEEAGRDGADAAARPDVEVKASRGDADSAAQPVVGGGAGGDASERPAS